MFFLFEDDSFDRALKEFRRTELDERVAYEAPGQISEFQRLFPLAELERMDLMHYIGRGVHRGGFCYWVTYGTQKVAGKIPFAQRHLGVRISRDAKEVEFSDVVRRIGEERHYGDNEKLFQCAIWHPLMRFVKSEGFEGRNEVENIFGRSLLLKILILYYPNQFAHILSVRWMDRIIWTFKLRQSGDFLDKNREVAAFIHECLDRHPNLTMSDVVAAMYDYIGLGAWEDDGFGDYLVSYKGFSQKAAEDYSRAVRRFSRELVTKRVTAKSIDKMDLGKVKEILNAQLTLSDGAASRTAIELYLDYRGRFVGRKRFLTVVKEFESEDDNRYVASLKSAKSADEVVKVLQDSALNHRVYWHYTILSSLLCILEDKTLRLTRGDDPQMNDQLEWERMGNVDTWRRTFITSFSHLNDESVAMWSVYGVPKNEAVRLAIDQDAMKELLNEIRNTSEFYIADTLKSENRQKVERQDVCIEFGDVLYGGNVNQKGGKQYEEFEFRGKTVTSELLASHTLDQSSAMTGYIKSADWSYEKESRLIVRIKDTVLLRDDMKDKTHLIITIPERLLEKVLFLLGPCMGERLQAVAKASIERKLDALGMTAQVDTSRYSGRLKLKS